MAEITYITCAEAAKRLQTTTRYITRLCSEGRFDGAYRNGKSWAIPESSFEAAVKVKRRRGRPSREQAVEGLPFAIGTTSFADIVNGCYYADKTLLIRDLIEERCEVTVFSRPNRFGKTLNLDMLKTFFEKTDDDTSLLFRERLIWDCGKPYRDHQGVYPVVWLSFKDVRFYSWKEMFEALRLIIRDEYSRHGELIHSRQLSAEERQYIDGVLARSLSEVEYTRALLNLTRMLEKLHRCRVVVLIDECDLPIRQGRSGGFEPQAAAFIGNFLSAGLKDNRSLALGVLTGTFPPGGIRPGSLGLPNAAVNTLLDARYNEYFGLTADEVRAMAVQYGRREKLPEIHSWYGGYLAGNRELYNPWSVTNYFRDGCRTKPYWPDGVSFDEGCGTGAISELKEALNTLASGGKLRVPISRLGVGAGSFAVDSFCLRLFACGFLTTTGPASEGEESLELAAPNKETRRALADLLALL